MNSVFGKHREMLGALFTGCKGLNVIKQPFVNEHVFSTKIQQD